jgi:uncharacterized protein YbaP (TraB family)
MLWKFYKNDPEVCSYIFGTMHMSTKEAYTYADVAKKYIQTVSVYAAEMDLNDSKDFQMMQYFLLPEGQMFSSFFRPKQYQKYRNTILKSYKVDIQNFENYTPFFINNYLAELTLNRSESEPLDHYLWSYALSLGKELTGVESLHDQLQILKSIPLDFQIKSFKDTVKNLKAFRKKITALNLLYKRREVQTLYRITKKSMGKIRKLMIYDRNERMTQVTIEIHEKRPCFVAVGAAHLGGRKGVLSLLKKSGYKVKEVKQ